MTAVDTVSGVGVRYAIVFNIDTDTGLPNVDTASATPVQGTLIEGIKTFSPSAAAPQQIPHYGDDRVFAQDQLPPSDLDTFTITTAKSNLALDAMLEGVIVRSVGTAKMKAAATDQRGSEPQLFFATYRQALDTEKGSSTLGTKRQWHMVVYPSVRVYPSAQGFEQAATDKTYSATPTSVSKTPFGESMASATDGATESTYFEFTCDYQPRWNAYKGDGTITSFALSHPPYSSDYLTVYDNGTEVTPSSVNTSTANPAFTLSDAPDNGNIVMALIQTNVPGNT
ncbi:MAG: hypothetical protein PHO55_15500 [Thiomonas arsenitoxydans]|nr:hypothetical protein [Thiomonas arsenitoxydans]